MLKPFVPRIRHRVLVSMVVVGVLFMLLSLCCAPLTTSIIPTPGIHLVKTGPASCKAGDAVTFTYLVNTSGNVPLRNVTVIDDSCGPVVYYNGDTDYDGILEAPEVWVFTCTTVLPFDMSAPRTNTASVSGAWEDEVVVDTTSLTLYPCVLRKDVVLYKGEKDVPYSDPETSFPVDLSQDGVLLDSFLINESVPICLWLSQGTYSFAERPIPPGYLIPSQNVSFTTGVDAPDVWLSNVITFDLSVVMTGPVSCQQYELITYQYTLRDSGPASVTPLVVDDLCGVPVYLSGDSDMDGLLDPAEAWSYEALYNVTAEPGSVLTNIVRVTDAEGVNGSWVLGGDRNIVNNCDSWSVQVLPPEQQNKSWFALSVAVVGNGSVEADPDLVSYENGSMVNLTAVAVDGWVFDHWEGDLSGDANPAELLMDSNKSVIAFFKETEQPWDEYWLTVEITGNGSVLLDPELLLYPAGKEVQLIALADEGWVFDHWSGDLSGNETPAMLLMDGNKTVVAAFTMAPPEVQTYVLSVNLVGSGSVIRDPDLEVYPVGTVVMLTALADAGWVFDHWAGDLSGDASIRFLAMDANKSVWAYFIKQPEETHPFTHGPSRGSTNILPVADAGGPYVALVGEDLVMNGLGSFDPDGFLINFSWSFGDGTTATNATVVHQYQTVGMYLVTLTVVDNRGGVSSNTTVAHITVVNHPPSNPVITGPSEGVKGVEYTYSFSCSDPENDIISYRIDWGDWTTFPVGIVSSGELFVLSHNWTSSGTYTITIVVSDGQFTASSMKLVTIHDTPIVSNIAIIVLFLLLLLILIMVYLASRRKMKKE
jgi:chitodextrinase